MDAAHDTSGLMKGLRCRKGNYYGEFYDPAKTPTRREYPLRTKDRREAEIIYARLQREYALNAFDPWEDRRPGRIHLDEAVDAFLRTRESDHYSSETHRGYESTLGAFREAAPVTSADQVTDRHVERFVRRRGLAASTQNQYLQRIEAFCNWLVDEGYIEVNPATSVRKKLRKESPKRRARARRRRDFFMPDELGRVLTAIYTDGPDSPQSRQLSREYVGAMAEVATCTGLSISEVAALRHQDVRLRHVDTPAGRRPLAGQLRLARMKTEIERVIPLVPRAALLLSDWMGRARTEKDRSVFFGPRDRNAPIPTTTSHLFRKYIDAAGVEGRLTFHSTRHTFISWLLMIGLPVYAVKELAGHGSAQMTEKYAHTARRYLMGQARQVATDILAFYCPGIERERLMQVVRHAAGAGLGGYAFGGSSLLDVLFGASMYRPDETARTDMFKPM